MCIELLLAVLYFLIILIINYFLFKLITGYFQNISYLLRLKQIFNLFQKVKF